MSCAHMNPKERCAACEPTIDYHVRMLRCLEETTPLGRDADAIRALLEENERLKKPCTCGSGGHPRRCEHHPEGYEHHIRELNYEGVTDELEQAEARIEAALAHLTNSMLQPSARVLKAEQALRGKK